jgi:hypothetical protein
VLLSFSIVEISLSPSSSQGFTPFLEDLIDPLNLFSDILNSTKKGKRFGDTLNLKISFIHVSRSTSSQSAAAASPQTSVPAQASPPIRPPATSPNPTPMPGSGNRVGGEGRGGGIRQTTPDPDEVRRRRLAFLEKMQK